MTDKVYYFGYGANRDAKMIAAITGKPESELVGQPGVLEDYRLGVQTLANIPDTILPTSPVQISPRDALVVNWGEGFTSYVIQHSPGSKVSGIIWELSSAERERVRNWELIDFGWYEDCTGTAITESGLTVDIVTERVADERQVDHFVDGMDYPTWLHDVSKFQEIATMARHEYDDRMKTTE